MMAENAGLLFLFEKHLNQMPDEHRCTYNTDDYSGYLHSFTLALTVSRTIMRFQVPATVSGISANGGTSESRCFRSSSSAQSSIPAR